MTSKRRMLMGVVVATPMLFAGWQTTQAQDQTEQIARASTSSEVTTQVVWRAASTPVPERKPETFRVEPTASVTKGSSAKKRTLADILRDWEWRQRTSRNLERLFQ